MFPSGTTVASVDSCSQVTLSNAASSTTTGTGLTFGGTFSNPTNLFDFDPTAGTISGVSPAFPYAYLLSGGGAYTRRMLMLPTGQLLFSDSANLFVYTPDGSPDPKLIPVVDTVAYQGAGVFKLSGKRLNGQSAGSAYGDDVQTDENYPIVRLADNNGVVSYAKTSGWDPTRVGDGAVTVNFTLNPKLTTPGDYTLYASGAGLNSAGFAITITQAQINGQ